MANHQVYVEMQSASGKAYWMPGGEAPLPKAEPVKETAEFLFFEEGGFRTKYRKQALTTSVCW